MRFFHLSDLHIGKQLHHYNLKEDQEHILQEVVRYARELAPDAIVIAGDIYDKSAPSAEAVEIFDAFLTQLAELTVPDVCGEAEKLHDAPNPAHAFDSDYAFESARAFEPADLRGSAKRHIPILIIAGNHDSAQRLDYAGEILKRQHIFIAGRAPETVDEHICKVTLTDAYGEIDFWLLPFFKPGYVRGVFALNVQGDERAPESYQEAVKRLLEREHIDLTRRNVLVSHQFYTGADGEMLTCDSENIQVGGIDRIDSGVISQFDYAALGHLHGAQRAGQEHVRYCGTLLKYSVSESEQEKTLHVVDVKAKGESVVVTNYPLHPLHDVRKVRGRLEEILKNAGQGTADDYISITLTDEVEPYKPKEQLERVFSHILEVRMDNTRTRKKLEETEEVLKIQDPCALFGEFFREVQGRELTEEETDILQKCCSNAAGELC